MALIPLLGNHGGGAAEARKYKIKLKRQNNKTPLYDFLQDPLDEFKPVKLVVIPQGFNRSSWTVGFWEVHLKRPSSASNPHEQFSGTKVLAFYSFLQKNKGTRSTTLKIQEQFLNFKRMVAQ